MPDRKTHTKPHRQCSGCGKSVSPDELSYPFCSERCRTMDLANWRDEKYVITRRIEHSDLEEGE